MHPSCVVVGRPNYHSPILENKKVHSSYVRKRSTGVGYSVIYFTPFSTEDAWTRLYSNQPVTNKISARLTATDPIPIPSHSSLMSTSPTLETPPIHNSPSNAPVDLMTEFIALMHQTPQKNAILMAHLQTRPSPLSVQYTLIAPT